MNKNKRFEIILPMQIKKDVLRDQAIDFCANITVIRAEL
jgi:hypothetical protein